jgi:hypothetical protein
MSSDTSSQGHSGDAAQANSSSTAKSSAVERVLDWHRQHEQRRAARHVAPIDAAPEGTTDAGG